MQRSLRLLTGGLTAAVFATVGVVVPTAAGAAVASPVINEFSANTTGTDVEYLEVLGAASQDLSGYTILEIEGDAGTSIGTVDGVFALGTADAGGRLSVALAANDLENGTVSLLLVSGFANALNQDLDAENDGVLDAAATFTIIDAVAVNDGGAGDITYGGTTLGVAYDGLPFAPGGASRIPDGTDTGTSADWVRNDFDLAGIPNFTGTLVDGEAANTPGAPNALTVVIPPPPPADCEAPVVAIGSVQGSGEVSPVAGLSVSIEGVVVADFQDGGFDGYFLQDVGDGDATTSDGVFIYSPTGGAVEPGDVVRVDGVVSEFDGLTEITVSAVSVCASGAVLPTPATFAIPNEPTDSEALEGMLVTIPQTLTILEYFNFGRYGEIALGTERQMTPTAVFEPGTAEAAALAQQNALKRITLDDGRSVQNPDPAIHPNGQPFSLTNTFRGGDRVSNITGVLDFRFDLWRIQPTQGADVVAANPRPAAPEVGGNLTVASFNVLNYFTTLGSRGANDQVEFDRQEAKIVSAITEIDADVFGLIEIENSPDGNALNTLVAALNDVAGDGTYAAIETGRLGTDEITNALIYKPATVAPVGDFAKLDSTVDPEFRANNRPALAQTFADLESGEEVTVVVNHLKSKGSDCNSLGDPDVGDGQGNCRITRTMAAAALVDWLATGPTGAEPGRELVIGDLNSYDKEDPIQVLTGAGFTDLLLRDQGENAYSYVFDGQLGYLDYALAGGSLAAQVTDAAAWAINADEPSLLDYDTTFKQPAQDAIYFPDAYRSSDHDPVIVGLDFVAPELTVTADPSFISKNNNKWVTVDLEIDASDASGTVETKLVSTDASGKKAEVEVISDSEVRVTAAKGAVYTLTYVATDLSGNATTREVTITVAP